MKTFRINELNPAIPWFARKYPLSSLRNSCALVLSPVKMVGNVPMDLTLAAGGTRAAGLAVGAAGPGPPPPSPPPSPGFPPPLLPPRVPPPPPLPCWCMAVLSPSIIHCFALLAALPVPEVVVLAVGWLVVMVEVVAVAVVVAMFP
jgi:hypothetical protein